jgi:hypothetical protein
VVLEISWASITMLYFFLQAHILKKAYIVSLNELVKIRNSDGKVKSSLCKAHES